MEKLSKNDKVIITNDNKFWNNKEAIVISQSDDPQFDNNQDITEVKVKIVLNNDKNIIQTFPRYQLELLAVNEAINETLNIKSKQDFIDYFIGKECTFQGFDYDELYNKIELDDNSYGYNKSDLEEINYYENLRSIPCHIINCALSDDFDIEKSLDDNFNICYWDIEFDTEDILSAVAGEFLKIKNDLLEKLSKKYINKKEDIIHDYVYLEDINFHKIPSWFFVGKIAAAENISEDEIIKDAKLFGYKIYNISAYQFLKSVVAAKECKIQDIYDDYADYLQGDVKILEVK